jgi:hypothetical protein
MAVQIMAVQIMAVQIMAVQIMAVQIMAVQIMAVQRKHAALTFRNRIPVGNSPRLFSLQCVPAFSNMLLSLALKRIYERHAK